MQRMLLAYAGLLAIAGAACANGTKGETQQDTQQESVAQNDDALSAANGTCPPPFGTRPDPTLVNTDPFVLSHFPLQRVVDQLVSLGGGSGQTGTQLYQQLWDSVDVGANAMFPGTPHCDDPNGNFPLDPGDCPRAEAEFKGTEPPIFKPVALFNRFDLAPKSAENCGEYRIIYALDNGPGREFIIFEGVLPNPDPSCGLESCRPVVDFWESLASIDTSTPLGRKKIAEKLDGFYFNGLPGFEPVVHPAHYGASGGGGYGGPSGGQIRLNMFVGGPWQLREYHLISACGGIKPGVALPVSCDLVMQPVTVKNNPFRELFDANSGWGLTAPFELGDFPPDVASLAPNNVNQIAMNTPDQYNAPQSTSQDFAHDYGFQYSQGSPPNAFTAAVNQEIVNINRPDLTANDIMARATTQSCGGCHQLSNGAMLSQNGTALPRWPSSLGFVHVDEQSNLSEALWCSFLPFRKKVLDTFAGSKSKLCAEADAIAKEAAEAEVSLTVAGKPGGAN